MRLDPAHARPVGPEPLPGIASDSVRSLPVACATLGAFALLVTIAAGLLVAHAGVDWPVLPLSLVLFLPVGAFVVWRIGDHAHSRFGPANVVTAARGGLAALIGAGAWQFGAPSEVADDYRWMLVGTALVALSLDGVDGWLARRTGLVSRFGERFDMEVDAFLILMLCAVAFADGKAGAFVFAIGLMRYGFLAWAAVDRRLSRPLAPSFRRKTVCVLQIALLCAALLPPVEPPLSDALALASLGFLTWSFAADIRALLGRRA